MVLMEGKTLHPGTHCAPVHNVDLKKQDQGKSTNFAIASLQQTWNVRDYKFFYTTLVVSSLGHCRPQVVKTLQTVVPDMLHLVAIYIPVLRKLGKVALLS